MPPTLILNVGHDPTVLETRTTILRVAGYVVVTERSIDHAIEHFLPSAFDLVLMCHSIPAKDRKRLISRIRESGSRTPAVLVAYLHGRAPDAMGDAIVDVAPERLLTGIKDVLVQMVETPPLQRREVTGP